MNKGFLEDVHGFEWGLAACHSQAGVQLGEKGQIWILNPGQAWQGEGALADLRQGR